MGEAILVGGRMGAVEQVIYKWKQYQAVGTNTYYWNKYNVVTTVTYKWNKWNAVTTYTWNKYTTKTEYDKVTNWDSSSFTKEYSGFRIGGSSDVFSDFWISYGAFWITLGNSNTNGFLYKGSGNSFENVPGWYCYPTRYSSSEYTSWTLYHITSMSFIESNEGYYTFRLYHDYYYSLESRSAPDAYQGTVSSTSSSAYPNGGVHSDGYWYGNRSSSTSKGSTSYGQVTSTNSSAYPSNGTSGSYWYESAGSDISYSKGSISYPDVSSTNRSAYPDNGKNGDYWYVYYTYTTEYSQGDYIGDRLSTDRDRWPDNGRDGDYWYVFDGEA